MTLAHMSRGYSHLTAEVVTVFVVSFVKMLNNQQVGALIDTLTKRVTTPETDRNLGVASAVVCVILFFVVQRQFFLWLAAINLIHIWRIHRKIKAALLPPPNERH